MNKPFNARTVKKPLSFIISHPGEENRANADHEEDLRGKQQNADTFRGVSAVGPSLEIECQPTLDPSWDLRQDERLTVRREYRLVALLEQVGCLHHRI